MNKYSDLYLKKISEEFNKPGFGASIANLAIDKNDREKLLPKGMEIDKKLNEIKNSLIAKRESFNKVMAKP